MSLSDLQECAYDDAVSRYGWAFVSCLLYRRTAPRELVPSFSSCLVQAEHWCITQGRRSTGCFPDRIVCRTQPHTFQSTTFTHEARKLCCFPIRRSEGR